MFHTILVPLDGSDLAEHALPLATVLAEQLGIPLHLLRVVVPGDPDDRPAIASSYLDRLAQEARRPITTAVEVGTAADEILRYAGRVPGPLIVMTTHGRTGLSRWLVGSVADRVVRSGEVPVLLLRSGMPLVDHAGIQRILVPLDGSPLAESALPVAEELARAIHASIRLARTVDIAKVFGYIGAETPYAAPEVVDDLIDGLVSEAQSYLDTTSRMLARSGVPVETAVLSGYPADALQEDQEQAGVDLVVMTTHARHGLSRAVLGSVSDRLLQTGTVPILMINPEYDVPVTDMLEPSATGVAQATARAARP